MKTSNIESQSERLGIAVATWSSPQRHRRVLPIIAAYHVTRRPARARRLRSAWLALARRAVPRCAPRCRARRSGRRQWAQWWRVQSVAAERLRRRVARSGSEHAPMMPVLCTLREQCEPLTPSAIPLLHLGLTSHYIAESLPGCAGAPRRTARSDVPARKGRHTAIRYVIALLQVGSPIDVVSGHTSPAVGGTASLPRHRRASRIHRGESPFWQRHLTERPDLSPNIQRWRRAGHSTATAANRDARSSPGRGCISPALCPKTVG